MYLTEGDCQTLAVPEVVSHSKGCLLQSFGSFAIIGLQ